MAFALLEGSRGAFRNRLKGKGRQGEPPAGNGFGGTEGLLWALGDFRAADRQAQGIPGFFAVGPVTDSSEKESDR